VIFFLFKHISQESHLLQSEAHPELSKISCLDGLSLIASVLSGDLFLAKKSAVRL